MRRREALPIASSPLELGGPPAYRAGRRPPAGNEYAGEASSHAAGPSAGGPKLQLTSPLQLYVRDALRKIVLPNGEPPKDRSVFASAAGGAVADTRKPMHLASVPLPAHVERAVRQQTSALPPAVKQSAGELQGGLASSIIGRPSPDGATRVDMEAAMALSAYDLTVACSPTAAARRNANTASPTRSQGAADSPARREADAAAPSPIVLYPNGQSKLPRRMEELALPHKSRRVVRARMQPKDALSPEELPNTLRMIERGLVLQSKEAKAAQDQRASHEAREATVRDAVTAHRGKVAPLIHARNPLTMPDATVDGGDLPEPPRAGTDPRGLSHVSLLSPPRARAATPSERPVSLAPMSAAGLSFSPSAARPELMRSVPDAAASRLQNVTATKTKATRARQRRLAAGNINSEDDTSLGNTQSVVSRTPPPFGSRRPSRAALATPGRVGGLPVLPQQSQGVYSPFSHQA